MVAPAGVRSIAMMRSCLVLVRAAGFDDRRAGGLRDLGFLVFRPVEWVAALTLDLRLVMGSSEGFRGAIRRTTSAPPGQITRQGRTPKRASAAPSYPQQRSDQTKKPVNSEQDSCSSPSKGSFASLRRLLAADFDSTIRRFDPSRPSQPVLRLAGLPKRRENGPQIPAFRAFAFVSGLPLCRGRGGNRRKSPAFSANIPVLGRLSAETGSIRTAARGRHFAR